MIRCSGCGGAVKPGTIHNCPAVAKARQDLSIKIDQLRKDGKLPPPLVITPKSELAAKIPQTGPRHMGRVTQATIRTRAHFIYGTYANEISVLVTIKGFHPTCHILEAGKSIDQAALWLEGMLKAEGLTDISPSSSPGHRFSVEAIGVGMGLYDYLWQMRRDEHPFWKNIYVTRLTLA